MMFKDKKGWTTTLEVFVSILMLAGLISVILLGSNFQGSSRSENIYKLQSHVLRSVQLDGDLRQQVLDENVTFLNNRVDELVPNYLDCEVNVCDFTSSFNCASPDNLQAQNVYSKSMIIASTNFVYSPKELKLVCWEN